VITDRVVQFVAASVGVAAVVPSNGSALVKRKLVADALNYFLSKIIPGIMGLCSVLVFVRVLGYDQYGRYAVVFAITIAVANGMSGWLSQGIIRFQTHYLAPSQAANFRLATLVGCLISVVAGGITVGFSVFASGVHQIWVILSSSALCAAVVLNTVLIAWFQARLRSHMVVVIEAVRSVLCFLVPVLLFAWTPRKSYLLLILGATLGYLAPTVFCFFRLRLSEDTRESIRPDAAQRVLLRKVWNFGWPVALLSVCMQGLVVSDRYFIQRYCQFSDAGIYASMYDVVVRSFSLLFAPVSLAIHPLIMKQWNEGRRDNAIGVLRIAVCFQFVLFLPVLVLGWPLAPWLTRVVLGHPNPVAASIALPLAIAGFLWQVAGVAHKPLEIMCKTRRMLVGILGALAVNVTSNAIFVPRYGYRASALVSVASSLTYVVLVLVLTPVAEFRRQLKSQASTKEAESLQSEIVLG
jgi:O-antigen/teichoic acid export membrane protein